MSPLQIVGRLPIPPAALAHRFYTEAHACAELFAEQQDVHSQVVGTANTRKPELYGWAPNVDSHADKTGWVYLVCLNEGRTVVSVDATGDMESIATAQLDAGVVVRLNDHCTHWTEDDQARVALFVGSWPEPADTEALAMLAAGLAALETGSYYGAPRVRDGFRALLADECLAADADIEDLETMLLADAQREGRLIELCGKCDAPAVRPDEKWPYHSEMSRCKGHLTMKTEP